MSHYFKEAIKVKTPSKINPPILPLKKAYPNMHICPREIHRGSPECNSEFYLWINNRPPLKQQKLSLAKCKVLKINPKLNKLKKICNIFFILFEKIKNMHFTWSSNQGRLVFSYQGWSSSLTISPFFMSSEKIKYYRKLIKEINRVL